MAAYAIGIPAKTFIQMVGIRILNVLSLRRVGNKTRLVVCFLEQKHLTHSNKMVHLIGGKQQAQVLCGSRGHDLTIFEHSNECLRFSIRKFYHNIGMI